MIVSFYCWTLVFVPLVSQVLMILYFGQGSKPDFCENSTFILAFCIGGHNRISPFTRPDLVVGYWTKGFEAQIHIGWWFVVSRIVLYSSGMWKLKKKKEKRTKEKHGVYQSRGSGLGESCSCFACRSCSTIDNASLGGRSFVVVVKAVSDG